MPSYVPGDWSPGTLKLKGTERHGAAPDEGQLAFVRADAYLISDGQRRSHNIDYFTLIRDGEGDWKFVNGSYTTRPVPPQ